MSPYIYFTLGIIFGTVLRALIDSKRIPIVGNWRINEHDPEKDIFQLEFTRNPEIVYHKKQIAFNVIREKDTPHNDNI